MFIGERSRFLKLLLTPWGPKVFSGPAAQLQCSTMALLNKYTASVPCLNPHQNDQGRKGPCCFQRLIALKCLSVKKLKKISIPSLLSLLSSEPNFLLIK
jgi:hypothetical protein